MHTNQIHLKSRLFNIQIGNGWIIWIPDWYSDGYCKSQQLIFIWDGKVYSGDLNTEYVCWYIQMLWFGSQMFTYLNANQMPNEKYSLLMPFEYWTKFSLVLRQPFEYQTSKLVIQMFVYPIPHSMGYSDSHCTERHFKQLVTCKSTAKRLSDTILATSFRFCRTDSVKMNSSWIAGAFSPAESQYPSMLTKRPRKPDSIKLLLHENTIFLWRQPSQVGYNFNTEGILIK